MKAKYIKTIDNGTAIQKLYELEKEIDYEFDGVGYSQTNYIIASKADHSFAQEVMLFPADSNGEILDWIEIGCVKGTPTIEYVMKEYGYDIV